MYCSYCFNALGGGELAAGTELTESPSGQPAVVLMEATFPSSHLPSQIKHEAGLDQPDGRQAKSAFQADGHLAATRQLADWSRGEEQLTVATRKLSRRLGGISAKQKAITGGDAERLPVVVGEELQPLEQGSAGPTSVGLQAEDLSWGEMANVGK